MTCVCKLDDRWAPKRSERDKTEEMSSEKEKISESKSTEDFVLDQIKN